MSFAADTLAIKHHQMVVHAFPQPVISKTRELAVCRLVGREVPRQHAPSGSSGSPSTRFATSFGRTAYPTADEERQLGNTPTAIRDCGIILAASFEPPLPGFANVAGHLRPTIDAPVADAALVAAERSVPATDPAPVASVPAWPFEPEGLRGRAAQLAEAVGRRPAGRGAARYRRRRSDPGAVRARPVPPLGRRLTRYRSGGAACRDKRARINVTTRLHQIPSRTSA